MKHATKHNTNPRTIVNREARLRRALVQTQADDDRVSEWKEGRR